MIIAYAAVLSKCFTPLKTGIVCLNPTPVMNISRVFHVCVVPCKQERSGGLISLQGSSTIFRKIQTFQINFEMEKGHKAKPSKEKI
jgi:hypothetical protein